jgi:hypothetical protein
MGQTLPQPPQSFASVVVSSQPSVQQARVPVHAGPPLQVVVDWHVLPAHLSPMGHTMPQPPQLFGSLVVSWQPVEQQASVPQGGPPLQPRFDWHTLATQTSVGPHAMPHPPQSLGSLVVLSQPSLQQARLPVHAGPPLQLVVDWHALATHFSPAGHAWPQVPQSFGSLVVSSQPSLQHASEPTHAGPPLQLVVDWHMLATQSSPGGQTSPHAPQLPGSVFVSVQPTGQHVSAPVHAGSPWQLGPLWQTLSTHV